MGIKDLTKLIRAHAPDAIKENLIKNYFGRKIAIDASMSIYQFLIAVRQTEGKQLTDDSGETTSHLMGTFYRTIRMVENGIKPVYVFDGKPPTLKSGELEKRKGRREENEASLKEAVEEGNLENQEKFEKRTVKATKEHNDECRRLLKLMGIPFIIAPCEAEAQCAALARAGKVYASGSEDMDTLCFSTPILLRKLTFSEAKKEPIMEIYLDKVLEGLGVTMDEFIDLCILLGCDYCDSIKGIGPHRAFNLIKEHKSIEKVLINLDKKKHPVSEDWPFAEARELFRKPEILEDDNIDIKWTDPDEEGVVDFLVKEKNFNEERVRKGVQKLKKNRKTVVQGRLDGFFTTAPKDSTSESEKPLKLGKRKTEDKKGGVKKKVDTKKSGSKGKPRR
ncbi:Elongation of fatty acids protein 2 [Clydaea vesicula]|uniref:Flap endonuclease 1 n=1 Tax=Clydaea vesicula TaxID=447962 RepID=A0AAD5U0S8_9FUNG|nr:Elongation of fatty acids protein 2 [Clydaea vesicula]KAJ3396529.1 Elongation of fatty acids protein 2 [Lobulomyces angularis]